MADKEQFVKVELYAPNPSSGFDEKPYATILAAQHNFEDYQARYGVLELQEFSKENNSYVGRMPEFGDYLFVLPSDKIVLQILSSEELSRCIKLNEEFLDIHANSPYIITGKKFESVPSFYDYDKEHKFPYYKKIEEKIFDSFDIPKNLFDAEKWLLQNHPEYYFGSLIKQQCTSGGFSMIPTPDYYEVEYGTNNRQEILRNIAIEKGIDITSTEPSLDSEAKDMEQAAESQSKGQSEREASKDR